MEKHWAIYSERVQVLMSTTCCIYSIRYPVEYQPHQPFINLINRP